MAEFDEHEFDEGLRRVAEGQGMEPPPALWNGIRMGALERQLISYQSAALWFKGIIGVLTVLLGVTGIFLYQAKNESTSKITQAVVSARTDTVYLSRTERVFADRPVVVYLEKKSANSQPENSTPDSDSNDRTNTLISSQPNSQSTKGNNGDPSLIDAADNPSVNSETTGKNQRINVENLVANNPNDPALTNSITNVQRNSKSDEDKGNPAIDKKTKTEKSRTAYPLENSENRSEFSSLVRSAATEGKVLFKNGREDRMVFDVTRLNAWAQKSRHTFKWPKILYQKPLQVQASQVQPKVAKIRTPLPERLSLSVYAAPDWNKLNVRRDEPDAFNYGDEELQTGILAGVRVGLKLSGKWSLLAGGEFSGSGFDNGKRRHVLPAETIQGRTTFPYRTALGTIYIPAELLSSPPTSGDRVGLEVDEHIQRYALNLPIALRYDIWQKRFLLLKQLPLRFATYGLLGGYAQIPLRQEGKVKIFEDSGREFETDITGFRNLRPAYDLSLGAGAELGVGKHLSIFAEPTYAKGLTSVVKDMPLRTTIGGFNVKLGAKWEFGKR